MLDSTGFDGWGDGYDDSVRRAEENNEYPFAGYSQVMNMIYSKVRQAAPAKVLDVGVGTAVLTQKLYDAGCIITGMDFSPEMISAAQSKMPDARLIQWDFTHGLPPALAGERFDFIISTYALHHLEDIKQTEFIIQLLGLLSPQGKLLLGDVCFQSDQALSQCKEASGDLWDDEENYIVFSGLQPQLAAADASFYNISACAGVIEIKHRDS